MSREKAISTHIGNFYMIHSLAANNIFPTNDRIMWRAISLYHDIWFTDQMWFAIPFPANDFVPQI